MAQLFPKYANSLFLLVLGGVVLAVIGGGYVLGAVIWSPYGTRVDEPREQPVPFSHKHHVGNLGIDCRYCHTTVETARDAGLPSTQTCMNCHSYVWQHSDMLAPVRESWRKREPISWTRVYDLPDYVYFDHSMHITRGLTCDICHGHVEEMPITYAAVMPYMKWCLDCHRDPEKVLREKGIEYHPTRDLTECYVCHR